MRRVVGCCVAGLVVVGGCRGEEPEDYPVTAEREPYEELATAADTAAEAFATDEAVGVVAVQGGRQVPGPLTATGNVQGPTEGSPPGAVTITEADGQTELLITLHGYEAGSRLQAVFVRGACGQAGDVVHAVEPVIEVPAEGIAAYETTALIPTRTLFDGAHSIRLDHPTVIGGDGARLADVSACADLMEVEG
ncbi:MAG: hypothetical protein WD766_06585 [Gemmatimonadota bacterium]